jgi:hypothetical protein
VFCPSTNFRASTDKERRTMRIPRLVWNRGRNVAALTVSYGPRVWHTREVGDLILGYNAAGRLSRVVILDPHRLLPAYATAREAILNVTAALLRAGEVRQKDLDVLRSALDRANAPPAVRHLRTTS